MVVSFDKDKKEMSNIYFLKLLIILLTYIQGNRSHRFYRFYRLLGVKKPIDFLSISVSEIKKIIERNLFWNNVGYVRLCME